MHEERRVSKRQDGDEENLPVRVSLGAVVGQLQTTTAVRRLQKNHRATRIAPMENRSSESQERLLPEELSSAENRYWAIAVEMVMVSVSERQQDSSVKGLVGSELHDRQSEWVHLDLAVLYGVAKDIGDAGGPPFTLYFGMVRRARIDL